MMGWIWGILFCVGVVTLTINAGGDAAVKAMLDGAQQSVTICISLAGAYLLWMGLLGIAKKSGLIDALSKKIRRPVSWLFPGAGNATGAITLNIAANMLGMGNAATPFGLEAMRLMQQTNKTPTVATTAMCAFLAVNASALQLIPTTLISLRQAAGSMQPGVVILPSFLSSLLATLAAVAACKWCMRRK